MNKKMPNPHNSVEYESEQLIQLVQKYFHNFIVNHTFSSDDVIHGTAKYNDKKKFLVSVLVKMSKKDTQLKWNSYSIDSIVLKLLERHLKHEK